MNVALAAPPSPTADATASVQSMADLRGLRLCLVGPLSPPAGGMAAQTRQLADLLTASGLKVELVQTNRPYRPAWTGRIPVLRAVARLGPYLASLWRAAGRAELFHVMANSGWAWHLFAAPAIRIASWRRVPVVVNYRGGEAADFLQRSGARVRRTMRRAARLIVPSGFLQDIFARHDMPASIVPNVVDLGRFKPAAEAPAGRLHVVVARNLEKLYDNASAIRAFAQLQSHVPQARMTIAGTGPEADALHALARSLGVESAVRFAGRLDRDAMAALYHQADISLNPSLADNMPNSVLEAMACGVPVVSTRVGGIPYLLRDGDTALLVPAADPAAMAQAMQRLHDDAGLRHALREQGQREVQRYTWARVAPVLAQVYAGARRAPRV